MRVKLKREIDTRQDYRVVRIVLWCLCVAFAAEISCMVYVSGCGPQ